MDDREAYDFKKKLEIILNQCAESKNKDYDDTFNGWEQNQVTTIILIHQ